MGKQLMSGESSLSQVYMETHINTIMKENVSVF